MRSSRGLQVLLGQARILLANAVWIAPAISAVAAFVFASYTSRVTFTTPFALGGLFTTGGAQGARDLVQTVASTTMTVSTLVISATIVVLQIAGSQYSPRLPGQFLRDKATQIVISIFVFTFIYSLSIVRSIHANEAFVPNFAVTVCFVMIIISVLAFVYYIHHVVQSVRIETILQYIERQALRAAERTFEPRESEGDPNSSDGSVAIPDSARALLSDRSGIVQHIDADDLIDFTAKENLFVCFTKRLGDHVAAGTPLGWIWFKDGSPTKSDELVDKEVQKVLQIGHERDLEDDVAFGLTQLTDITLRALSPAINDPTTGCNALQATETVLVRLCGLKLGDRFLSDSTGTVRIIVPQRSFSDMLDQVVTPVRHAAADELSVVVRLCELLANLARVAADDDQRDTIAIQTDRLLRASDRAVKARHDRKVVFRAGRQVDLALAGKPPDVR